MDSKRKGVSIERLLCDLDSVELKELRVQFLNEVSKRRHDLAKEEEDKLNKFVDNLSLHRGWYSADHLDAVTLIKFNLPIEQRVRLSKLSDTISRAFDELARLKREVADTANREGKPNSAYFYTTVKRMKKFVEKRGWAIS
jgi:hypothetical protein